jgi:hypothetical protein
VSYSGAVAITGVTRRALFSDLANTTWWGDCRDEIEFMNRLYALDSMPSDDARFRNAREDFHSTD